MIAERTFLKMTHEPQTAEGSIPAPPAIGPANPEKLFFRFGRVSKIAVTFSMSNC